MGQRSWAEPRQEPGHRVLCALAEAQMEYIRTGDTTGAFALLLQALLEVTGSECCFIGEVCAPGVLALRAACGRGGLSEFTGQSGLQGEELLELQPLLEATPPSSALPRGHPLPSSWLALPLEAGGERVGLVAMANAPAGYTKDLVASLQPFLATCSGLLQARREQRRRRQAEEELCRHQERLHKLALVAARTHNAVILTDAQGRVEWVNEGFTRITGYTLSEVEGHKPGELLQGPGSNPHVIRSMSECLRRGQGFNVELLNYHKSGRPYWISIEAQPLYDEQGRLIHFMAIESDITERRLAEERLRQSEEELKRHRDHLEELVHLRTQRLQQATRELEERHVQLIQSEKLASLGLMAAGIAHEINNPVAYVMSNLSTLGQYAAFLSRLLRLYLELEGQAQGWPEAAALLERIREVRREEDLEHVLGDLSALLRESLEGTERVKEIVQGLRTFARQESDEPQLVEVNKGLESTLKMVWNELKYRCEVRCEYGAVPPVMGYPTQLNQVFMNLLLNAAQAMDTRGEIRVSTALEGREVVIRIADTGHGMTEETLARLFTPFFTTKPPGKGTGLGLSISYGIIHRHGGRIEVWSKPGWGSTFTLYLPAAQD